MAGIFKIHGRVSLEYSINGCFKLNYFILITSNMYLVNKDRAPMWYQLLYCLPPELACPLSLMVISPARELLCTYPSSPGTKIGTCHNSNIDWSIVLFLQFCITMHIIKTVILHFVCMCIYM